MRVEVKRVQWEAQRFHSRATGSIRGRWEVHKKQSIKRTESIGLYTASFSRYSEMKQTYTASGKCAEAIHSRTRTFESQYPSLLGLKVMLRSVTCCVELFKSAPPPTLPFDRTFASFRLLPLVWFLLLLDSSLVWPPSIVSTFTIDCNEA